MNNKKNGSDSRKKTVWTFEIDEAQPESLVVYHDPIKGTFFHFGPALSGYPYGFIRTLLEEGFIKDDGARRHLEEVAEKLLADAEMLIKAKRETESDTTPQ